MSVLQCKNVSLQYQKNTILKNINFTIHAGDFVCIVGHNGSGKSTLLHALVGIHKEFNGEIIHLVESTKKTIGYVSQLYSISTQFPASVWEVVISGCLNQRGIRPYYSKQEKCIAKQNMQEMSILELANKSFQQLSGGQKQRVLLARALCASSQLLILDEPETGLDQEAQLALYALLYTRNQKHNTTIIMVTHDFPTVMKYASHVLCIKNKETVIFNPIDTPENTQKEKNMEIKI